MRISYWICLISVLLCGMHLSGQRSYAVSLPQAGDVHYYKLDNLPENISLDFQNQRNSWNLTSLSAPTAHSYSFKDADHSIYASYFVDADIVAYDLWENELFYKKYGNGLFLVGEVIKVDRDKANPILKKYTDPKPEYATTYKLGSDTKYDTKWEIILNGDELNLDNSLNESTFRLEATEHIEEIILSAGMLFLPRQMHDAIKVERSIITEFELFRRVNQNQWESVDISSVAQWPIVLEKERKEVIYLGEGVDERLAKLRISERGEISKALFKSTKEQVKINSVYQSHNFFLYPNPTFGLVRLDFVNIPKGKYVLDVYNIIGKKLWSQEYFIHGYTTIKEDLSFLQKGTYLYSLSNNKGKKILTRKMAIITP